MLSAMLFENDSSSIYSAVGVEIVSIIKFRGVAPLILLYAAAICSLRLTSSSSLIVVVYIVLWHHPTSKSKIYMYYILCVCGWIMNWRRLHTWSERWKPKQILIFFCFCFTLSLIVISWNCQNVIRSKISVDYINCNAFSNNKHNRSMQQQQTQRYLSYKLYHWLCTSSREEKCIKSIVYYSAALSLS